MKIGLKSAGYGSDKLRRYKERLSTRRSVHFTPNAPLSSPSTGVLLCCTRSLSGSARRSASAQGPRAAFCGGDEGLGKCALISSLRGESTSCVRRSPPAAHRGRGLRRPAVSVQEEEREAHRRGDAAGGPARYGSSPLGVRGYRWNRFSVTRARFVAWLPKTAARPPSLSS